MKLVSECEQTKFDNISKTCGYKLCLKNLVPKVLFVYFQVWKRRYATLRRYLRKNMDIRYVYYPYIIGIAHSCYTFDTQKIGFHKNGSVVHGMNNRLVLLKVVLPTFDFFFVYLWLNCRHFCLKCYNWLLLCPQSTGF